MTNGRHFSSWSRSEFGARASRREQEGRAGFELAASHINLMTTNKRHFCGAGTFFSPWRGVATKVFCWFACLLLSFLVHHGADERK
jgi:hypothetical protein